MKAFVVSRAKPKNSVNGAANLVAVEPVIENTIIIINISQLCFIPQRAFSFSMTTNLQYISIV